MTQPEKTVFISYRRSVSAFIARAVFMDLRAKGWDVFMDVESIDSGEFENVILTQIAARTHFVLVLTQGTLDRCENEDDWLRREIEMAMDLKRNIIPIVIGDFKIEQAQSLLTGKLSKLTRFNAVDVPHTYFEAAMDKLNNRFLKPPSQPILAMPSPQQQQIAEERLRPLVEAPPPTHRELSAEEHFVHGLAKQDANDISAAIECYTKAVDLNPQYYRPFYNRALLYHQKKQYDEAIADYGRAIVARPDYAKAFVNRGVAWLDKGQILLALQDYERALAIQPDYSLAFLHRANAYRASGDIAKAIDNYQQYLSLGGGKQYDNQQDVEAVIKHLQKPNQSQSSGVTGFLRRLFNTDTYDTAPVISGVQAKSKNEHSTIDVQPFDSSDPLYLLGGSTRPLAPDQAPNISSGSRSWGFCSDVGLVRSTNQDAAYGFDTRSEVVNQYLSFGFFMVADGMGGQQDGEKASSLAVSLTASQILKTIYLPRLLNTHDADGPTILEVMISIVQKVNKQIKEDVPDGGTTLTAALLIGDLVYIVHVGDSRIYLITQDGMEQISRDHSLVQRLVELGQLTPEEVQDHPQKNVLYRALGQNEIIDVDCFTRRLPRNSQLLLCTDGLWSFVDEKVIVETVLNNPNPQEACDKLVALANTQGGSDNISVIIINQSN